MGEFLNICKIRTQVYYVLLLAFKEPLNGKNMEHSIISPNSEIEISHNTNSQQSCSSY